MKSGQKCERLQSDHPSSPHVPFVRLDRECFVFGNVDMNKRGCVLGVSWQFYSPLKNGMFVGVRRNPQT